MTLAQFLLATALVAAGACVQGSVGFGMGLLSAPLLALLDADYVPAPVLMATIPLSLMVVLRERRALDLRGLGWAFAGRLPGTVAGVVALAILPSSATSVLFGVLVLAAVGLTMAGWHLTPTPGTLVTAGVASGFMGTTTSIGGPPIALVYQHSRGAELRSTLATYFVVGAFVSLVALAIGGDVGRREIGLGLTLLPGMAIGFLASGWMSRHLDRGRTRAAVLATSALAGVAVVVSALV